ncbi:MAG: hypothetical protein M1608_06370 [Candidatus Omnitrophica bacterium]|nr:hypothetical protein [Candidatus Omnitrophota bacterium]
MNYLRTLLELGAGLVIGAGAVSLWANTASIKIEDYSFVLEPITYTEPGYAATTIFTTYDGGSGAPLHDGDTYSAEVKPDSSGSATYRTDYVTMDALGLESYGTMVFTIPNTDSDGNGLPDVVQKDKAVSLSLTGTQYCQYARDNDGQNITFSGTITRSAGSATGTVVVSGPTLPEMSTSYHLIGGDGTLTYDPQSGDSTFVIQMWPVGDWSSQLNGRATLSKNGPNEITMANLHGDTFSFTANVVMQRQGNTYCSQGQISDGYDATSWPDYQGCLVEIADSNDADGDGIPDLTDDPLGLSLEDALDAPAVSWTTGGAAGWAAHTDQSHDGVDSARSGGIGDNQTSWLETTVTGPLPLSFWWKVSSEEDYDYLRFAIDGVEQTKISGETDWQQERFNLSAGTHTLRWSYTKDGSDNSGSDGGWLDQVSFAVESSFHWAAGDVTVREDAGQVTLNVRRVGSSTGPASVDYFTTNGTAQADSDFVAASGTIAFADGETNQSVVITILNDTQWEENETFGVGLRNSSSGYTVGSPAQATVTLTDDEERPVGASPILFTSDRDGDFEIFIMNDDGSGLQQLTSNTNKDSKARWAPDGRTIYFIRDDDEVWKMDRDGQNQQRVTDGESVAVSPDGKTLAIARFVDFYSARELYLRDLATGHEIKIAKHTGEDYHPDFSPDGRQVVYVNYFLYYGDYYKNLYVVNTDGTGERQLTDYDEFNPAWPDNPRWSPDGTRILFSNHGEGQDDILQTISPHGTNHIGYISSSAGSLTSPVWSPDGHWVLVTLNGRILKVDFPYTTASYLTPSNSTAYVTDWLCSIAPPTPDVTLGPPQRNPDGSFHFDLQGPPASNYVIQVSTNLTIWMPLATNTIPAEGVLTVTDPASTKLSRRFYRAVQAQP